MTRWGSKFLFLVSNMAFFDCDGVRLMFLASEKPGETYNSVIYFKVPDIHRVFRTLSRAASSPNASLT